MVDVVIIYDSKTGNTASAAAAICEGAKEAGAKAVLIKAEEASAGDLVEPKGVILGAYCMMNKIPPTMRKFMEQHLSTVDMKGKVGAVFGSYKKTGKQLPLLESALKDRNVRIVAEGVNALGSPDDRTKEQLRDMGRKVGGQAIKKK